MLLPQWSIQKRPLVAKGYTGDETTVRIPTVDGSEILLCNHLEYKRPVVNSGEKLTNLGWWFSLFYCLVVVGFKDPKREVPYSMNLAMYQPHLFVSGVSKTIVAQKQVKYNSLDPWPLKN